ncbi:putative phage tail protein [Paenibacillus tyrfis]|uniref:putative phage tail protein n=1 Tax=Paenibacillus tyrfis TaxID=1501230 RepID=UPI000B591EC4|nr:putative phage tail protein [Paenibacillus tyrfis]
MSIEITSLSGQRLLSYLSGLFENSDITRELLQSEGVEFDNLYRLIEETLSQNFVDTATWALERWENELAIPVDRNKPISERRSVVKSKIRGSGPATIELLKTVAQSYERGAIDVIDTVGEYSFEIRFIDTLGVPPNLHDMKAAIEEVKPAHLDVRYAFRYLTVAEVEGMTLQQLENTTLDKFAWG